MTSQIRRTASASSMSNPCEQDLCAASSKELPQPVGMLRRQASTTDVSEALRPPPETLGAWRAAWRVAHATGAQLRDLQPMKAGWSGFSAYSARLGERRVHVKVHLGKPDAAVPPRFSREVLAALRMGKEVLGPRVLHASTPHLFLLTELIEQQYGDWAQASAPPKRPAMLATLARLHAVDRDPQARPVCVETLASEFAAMRQRLDHGAAADPHLQRIDRRARAVRDMLQLMRFHRCWVHGDPQQANLIYSAGRVWLIDCDEMQQGDPMTNIAYLAFHIDRGVRDLPALMREYADPPAAEDVLRAQLYLTHMYAERYVSTAVGMPWNNPETQAADLERLSASFEDGVIRVQLATWLPGAQVGDITPLKAEWTGADVYRVEVDGAPYVLKRVDLHEWPQQRFAAEVSAARSAAAAGLGPAVLFHNVAAGALLQAYVA